MSLPQTSLELADRIYTTCVYGAPGSWHFRNVDAAALIETYVAERILEEATWWYRRKTWPNEEDSARLKQLRTERMQPAGEANDRQGGE